MKNPILHGVLQFVVFALPIVISANFGWEQLTIGGILSLVLKAAENRLSGLTVGGNPRF